MDQGPSTGPRRERGFDTEPDYGYARSDGGGVIHDRRVDTRETDNRRASWFGVFGGTLVALGVSSALGLLGFAIGATSFAPMGDGPSAKTFGVVAGIYWVVSGLIALFVGGLVTAKLSAVPEKVHGALHGLTTWGLATVAALWIMTSTATSVLTGAFGLVGDAASTVARGASAVAGQLPAMNLPEGGEGSLDAAWQGIMSEAKELLRQTDTKQLQPGNLSGDAKDVAQEARQAASADSLAGAGQDLEDALMKLRQVSKGTIRAADTDAVVNVLTARTDMSEEEARQKVESWSDELQQSWSKTKQMASQASGEVEDAALQAADTTADTLATAGWWSFVYLLLTAGAAAGGGVLGAPRREASHARYEDQRD